MLNLQVGTCVHHSNQTLQKKTWVKNVFQIAEILVFRYLLKIEFTTGVISPESRRVNTKI